MIHDDYSPQHDYILELADIAQLDELFILNHSAVAPNTEARYFFELHPHTIALNAASFMESPSESGFPAVTVIRQRNHFLLTCDCDAPKLKLCRHQAQVLYNIIRRAELRIFFDDQLRRKNLLSVAKDYGLEQEAYPDHFFELEYQHKTVLITPKIKELFNTNPEHTKALKAQLLPAKKPLRDAVGEANKLLASVLIFSEHKYYKQYKIELYQTELTLAGRIKTVLQPMDPVSLSWKADQPDVLRFYMAVSKFQHSYEAGQSAGDIEALQALIKNPLALPVFLHDPNTSPNFNSSSLTAITLEAQEMDLHLNVDMRDDFYEVTGQLLIGETAQALDAVNLRHGYFVLHQNSLQLINQVAFLKVIDFFRKNHNRIVIHPSKFDVFRQDILAPLEHRITTSYAYLKPATKEQLQELELDERPQQILYLSDDDNHVLLTPVMKYGATEVPVLSRQNIYATDKNGTDFLVERNKELELRFVSILLLQYPEFEAQLDQDYFHLSKNIFLEEAWFLDAFEGWQQHDITVLGFNELKDNVRNPHKGKVSVSVKSGQDWFEASIKVEYGSQRASLKHLHKAIRNKSKFVQLDDGTMGLLPAEWLERFARYFQSGELVAEEIRIPKISFSVINQLYEDEVLADEVKAELRIYKQQLADFQNIQTIEVPMELKGTLRDYQHEGLNWLNFLDDFNFGGCLADDMGLGKTIQIIAFILAQRSKRAHNTNLIIVPTTLLFNWQAELEKFAPSIKVHTIYGAGRIKNSADFDAYEVVLTSYGTLLNDVRFLKQYRFNYIFLDESQNIKNPESQRYKAARLLQSRNKIVLTGTPVENNTFDLYGQLSFACPGLLGSRQHFKEQYSTPIDKFKNTKRALELQQKVRPFILRRTKKQVARELPDKTEMVLYCELGAEQRKVYDYYRKEYRDFLLSKQEDDYLKYTMHVLKGLTILRQICDSPLLLKDRLVAGDTSAKIDTLMEEIAGKAGQHKILVFSQFVAMLDLIKPQLEARNIPYQYLTGKTKNRAEKVTDFQENEGVRVFLISLKAGGTGLNLTGADYVYIIDPWWNPAVENQAIDRCYRIGQKKNVVAVRLICPDTIEEKMMKLQESKHALVNELIRTDGSMLKSFSRNELIDLFS